MRIKVCGLREPENVQALLEANLDFVGFIFFKGSKRNVTGDALSNWVQANETAFGETKRVGVFVNAEIEFVLNKVHDYQLDYVQFHGNESPEYCREIQSYWEVSTMRQAKIIKAFSVDDDFDFDEVAPYEPICDLLLFDTKGESGYGGHGVSFNWQVLEGYEGLTPFLLSGGIDLDRVGDIKALTFPKLYGVDINSKFEIEPGLKDVTKVKQFVELLKK